MTMGRDCRAPFGVGISVFRRHHCIHESGLGADTLESQNHETTSASHGHAGHSRRGTWADESFPEHPIVTGRSTRLKTPHPGLGAYTTVPNSLS